MAIANLPAHAESINSIHPKMKAAGFVPASPECKRRRSNMLMPKPHKRLNPKFMTDLQLTRYFGNRVPRDVRALARIVDTADLIEAEGRQFLLVEADARLIDDLATFHCEIEDFEPQDDSDTDNDNAWEIVRGPHRYHHINDDFEPEEYR